MACAWDADLIEQAARATAVEVSATGLHWTFSPVLCIARDPRWGRVDETFGEDPHLIGELGAAMIRGYQGDGLTDPTAVLATDNAMSSDNANNAANCFLTVVEVADRLGVSPKHVRRAIDRGELPVHRFGRAVRIAPEDLERFISRHRA